MVCECHQSFLLCTLITTRPTFRFSFATSFVRVSRYVPFTIKTMQWVARNRPTLNNSIANCFGICIASENSKKYEDAKAKNLSFGHSHCAMKVTVTNYLVCVTWWSGEWRRCIYKENCPKWGMHSWSLIVDLYEHSLKLVFGLSAWLLIVDLYEHSLKLVFGLSFWPFQLRYKDASLHLKYFVRNYIINHV